MAKFQFDIKEEITLFQLKRLIIFLIKIIESKIPNFEIDDTITKIPDEIKNQFKKL